MSFNKKKQQFIDFCSSNDNQLHKYNLPKIFLNQKLEAVFIEFRLLHYTSFIIKNAIKKLGSEWSFTIICGDLNYDFYQHLKNELELDIKIINLGIKNITREDYSILLLQSSFWNKFNGDHILIYQEDSLIFRKFDPKFLKYDFIGAPYTNKEIGNGGFSLRKRKTMIKICKEFFDSKIDIIEKNVKILNMKKKLLEEKFPNQTSKDIFSNKEYYYIYLIERSILEDLQICNRIKYHHKGILPDFNTCTEFSIEKYYNNNAFGGHQFWYCIKDIKKWLDENFKLLV